MSSFHLRPLAAACGALLLGACASFSPDGGFSSVQQSTRQYLGKELVWARSEADQAAIAQQVRALLAAPLSADAAVQLALLNNRGLQAAFQDLGITEAELVQAGRLANPGFSIGRLRRGDDLEIERSLHLNLARLISRP